MRIDVIRLGLAADDVAVAPGLQRIQHEDAVARADERHFKVFPEVARGLEPDQGLRRRRAARVQRNSVATPSVLAAMVKLGPTASPSRSRTAIRCSRNATSMPTNRSAMALPSRDVGARRGSAGQVPRAARSAWPGRM